MSSAASLKEQHVLPRESPSKRASNRFQFIGALKSIGKVISGNITANLITMVTSILIARWTTPSDMGIWNFALLVTLYAPTLQLGVFNGLNRELPYLIGAGKKGHALHMAEAAYAWAWLLVGLSILCGAVVAVWFWVHGLQVESFASLAIAAIIASSWPTLYLTTTYRTHAEFGRLAKNTVVVALTGVALALLVWRFHFEGLILRAALLAVLGVAALYFRRPFPVKPQWRTDQLVQLAKVGIPIWLIGQLGLVFISLDRLVLAKSTEALGYFTIAIQVATFVRMIPTAFGIVLYPHMAHQFGETRCANDLWLIAKKSALASSALGLVVGVFGWLLLPTFVHFVLPKYAPGIRAAQWSGLLGFAAGLDVFDHIFNVIKRQDLFLVVWGSGCAVFFASWFSLTRLFHVSLLVASSESLLLGTFVMALVSAFMSRKACQLHDQSKAG